MAILNYIKLIKILLIFINISFVVADKNRKNTNYKEVYDQQQTGDYNIRVNLNDFQVIALLGDSLYGDYDYNYDYSDLTVKPVLTSEAPLLNTTSNSTKLNSTELNKINGTSQNNNKTSPIHLELNKLEEKNETALPAKIITLDQSQLLNLTKYLIEKNPTIEESLLLTALLRSAEENEHKSDLKLAQVSRKCSNGFVRDNKGRCRRIKRKSANLFQKFINS